MTDHLGFQTTAQGVRRANIGIMLVVYSRAGQPLQVRSRTIDVAIPPEDFKESQKTGIQVHGAVEFPLGESHLRNGVFDYETGTLGTLTVPVSVTGKQ